MPRRCAVDPLFPSLLVAQDYVVSRQQAQQAGLTPRAIDHRVASGQWQRLLPGVFLCHPGEPARRQRLIAALLYCGADSAIDGTDACRYYGIKSVPTDDVLVHVAVPPSSTARSCHWVVVRRTASFDVIRTQMARYVDPATAVISATRRMSSPRGVLAAVSEAMQRRVATPDQLLRAHIVGPRANAKLADEAIGHVRGGIHSAREAEFRLLADSLPSLPPLLYNRRLRMPDGKVLRPDAVAPDAPLVHETNGRVAHERDDLFEDMQARHDYLTTVGFTVLHNPPRRLSRQGRLVISEFETCYLRLAGDGWPEGVVLLEDVD